MLNIYLTLHTTMGRNDYRGKNSQCFEKIHFSLSGMKCVNENFYKMIEWKIQWGFIGGRGAETN